MKNSNKIIATLLLISIINGLALGYYLITDPAPFNDPIWNSFQGIGGGDNVIVVDDFNGNGKADIATCTAFVVGSGNNELFIAWSDGEGGFSKISSLLFQAPTVKYGSVLQYQFDIDSGDINGDGLSDIVVFCSPINGGERGALTFINQGDGVFICPTDLNGDGSTDVVDLLDVVGNWGPCE